MNHTDETRAKQDETRRPDGQLSLALGLVVGALKLPSRAQFGGRQFPGNAWLADSPGGHQTRQLLELIVAAAAAAAPSSSLLGGASFNNTVAPAAAAFCSAGCEFGGSRDWRAKAKSRAAFASSAAG